MLSEYQASVNKYNEALNIIRSHISNQTNKTIIREWESTRQGLVAELDTVRELDAIGNSLRGVSQMKL